MLRIRNKTPVVKKKNSRDSKLSFILIGPKYGGRFMDIRFRESVT
ncbi:hypothetical protein JCM19297_1763 [Nonlabens ulvanivorans]|nr:hypothetical protein JCM19297_1763 [Nonlabens ulvanivorans]